MTEIVIFHHVQGLTTGIKAFANRLSQAGYIVHCPDLFNGKTFDNIKEGMAYVKHVGFDKIINMAEEKVVNLPSDLVYIGFSLGVVPAQKLAQTRVGAKGALLIHSCLPIEEFTSRWPDTVPVQIHAKESDPFFLDDGDKEAALNLIKEANEGELFLYPGDEHLFADESLESYDKNATELLIQRVLSFLDLC